jgi:hypothetical protein
MQPPEWGPLRFIMRPGWGAGTLSLPDRGFSPPANFPDPYGIGFGLVMGISNGISTRRVHGD